MVTPLHENFSRALSLWPQMRAPEAIAVLHSVLATEPDNELLIELVNSDLSTHATQKYITDLASRGANLHSSRGIEYPVELLAQGLGHEWQRNMNAVRFIILAYLGELDPSTYSQENCVRGQFDQRHLDIVVGDDYFNRIISGAKDFFFDPDKKGVKYAILWSAVLSGPERRNNPGLLRASTIAEELALQFPWNGSAHEQALTILSSLKSDFILYLTQYDEHSDFEWITFGIGLPRRTPAVFTKCPFSGLRLPSEHS